MSSQQIVHRGVSTPAVTQPRALTRLHNQTGRQVAAVEARAIVRMAQVRAEEIVTHAKSTALAHLVTEAVMDHDRVLNVAMGLAGASDLKFNELVTMAQMNRMAQERLINDLVNTYCREGMGY